MIPQSAGNIPTVEQKHETAVIHEKLLTLSDMLGNLICRVSGTADRILGIMPSSPEKSGASCDPQCALDWLNRDIEVLNCRFDTLEREFSRIERL